MPRKQADANSVYQLKVTLKGISPPIWRRIQVTGNTTLHNLHDILQEVMGWENAHLYEFEIGGGHFGKPDLEGDQLGVDDSTKIELAEVVPGEKARFTYMYDFGDSWEHEILVEKVLPAEKGVRYPICLAGKRACPPEDCGGVWGYEELLEVIQDPDHEQYEEMMEWVGEEFDPEEFDLEDINGRLEYFRP